MNKLLIGVLLLLMSLPGQAVERTAWFGGNPLRSGEGVSVFTRGEVIAFAFYTYMEADAGDLPVVSPRPPDITLNCVDIAGTPVGFSTWFVGSGGDFNGVTASGSVYWSTPKPTFPLVDVNGELNDLHLVGTFSALRVGDGWLFDFNSNGILPSGLRLFKEGYDFNRKLIGAFQSE